MQTKIQILTLLGISAMFAIGALVMILMALANRCDASVASPMLVASIIGGLAAGALASLHRRVSELERRAATKRRDSDGNV